MPRTKEQNETIREQKRRLIIDTALELFANEGYSHTSIAQIAKKAGISKGLLYNYFTSKEDLLMAVLQGGVELVDFSLMKNEMIAEDFLLMLEHIFSQIEENRHFYLLFTALSTQPNVAHIYEKYSASMQVSEMKYLTTFFQKHFKTNAMRELLVMSSIMKGYSILALYGNSQKVIEVNLLKNAVLDFYRERLAVKS